RSGQFAILVPDTGLLAPAPPVIGNSLPGVARPISTGTLTATGDVVPRSAPPGDNARATGRIGVTSTIPIPSGTFVQALVNERFDLLDQSQVITEPFTQGFVVYRNPAPASAGTIGATFPITPSQRFTIQQLMLGVVTLDVSPYAEQSISPIVGP